MSTIVPIGMSDRRLPQAGRIRTGEQVKSRNGKWIPKALDHFLFTSSDPELLAPLAEKYGGTVKEWDNPKSGDRYQVRSDATKINVVLPPEPLSQHYELWDPQLQRRCNGIECTVLVGTPDDADYQTVDCICARKGALECSYKLRLSVLIDDVPSLGTWRLDSGSDNVRKEMPGIVEAVEALQGHGFYHATLRLEQRRSPRKVYTVAVLDIGASIGALAAGESRLVQLPVPPRNPLPVSELEAKAAGDDGTGVPDSPAAPSADDEIVDAELIDEPEEVDPTIGRAWIDKLPQTHRNAALRRAREIARECGEPEPTTATAIPDYIINRLAEEADL